MDVSEIMTQAVVTANPGDPVRKALELLEDQHIRHLPVIDDGRLVGMLSDRDLREYRLPLMQELDDPGFASELLDAPVSQAMATQPIAVDAGESVRSTIDLMVEHGIGAVPVIDRHSDELIGIVSYVDVLKSLRTVA